MLAFDVESEETILGFAGNQTVKVSGVIRAYDAAMHRKNDNQRQRSTIC